MIDKLLADAHQAMRAARLLLDAGDTDGSINRSYYAAYYAAWALFAGAGVDKPKSHKGMISEFSRRFVKQGSFDVATASNFSRLASLRYEADYTLEDVPAEEAELALRSAATFVDAVEKYLVTHRG